MSLHNNNEIIFTELISDLNYKINSVVSPLLYNINKIALLDFPDHGNVGDSAIWSGENTYIKNYRSCKLVYTSDKNTYSYDQLKLLINDGVILLHGGGNLGDIWPAHQLFREKVIAQFPNNPIIQFPISVHFNSKNALTRAKHVINQHKDLTILLRDNASYEFAKKHFIAKLALCPDMAFCLGYLGRQAEIKNPTVFLKRSDKESAWQNLTDLNKFPMAIDWLNEGPSLIGMLNSKISKTMTNYPNHTKFLRKILSNINNLMAEKRVTRGVSLLSTGEVVITDRLHGHILCLLLGIPHAIIDNNNHKLTNFVTTWHTQSDLVQLCSSPYEAIEFVSDFHK